MTQIEQAWISISLGVIGVLIGIGLALAKIDPDELRKKSHANPGLALYRFTSYRWAVVVILFVFGAIMVVSGGNSLRTLH